MSITEKIISTLISDTEILSLTHEISGRIETSAGTLENLPPFCRVQLKMTPGSGSLIYTEVWLPDDWNGIFVGTGNGGIAGQVAYGWLVPFVQEGYAVANTDMGTSRGEKSGIGNPDVWKDFGWRATHLMTKAAKELIRVRYDRDPAYAYFVGSSTGGQQAMKEAQCFPEDYDGILAAVPANSRLNLHTFFCGIMCIYIQRMVPLCFPVKKSAPSLTARLPFTRHGGTVCLETGLSPFLYQIRR